MSFSHMLRYSLSLLNARHLLLSHQPIELVTETSEAAPRMQGKRRRKFGKKGRQQKHKGPVRQGLMMNHQSQIGAVRDLVLTAEGMHEDVGECAVQVQIHDLGARGAVQDLVAMVEDGRDVAGTELEVDQLATYRLTSSGFVV